MATQRTVYTDKPKVSDLIIWECDPGQRYCRVAKTLKNTSGSSVAGGVVGPGYPLNNNAGTWEYAVAGGEAGIDGLLADNEYVPALANAGVTSKKYSILVRGPALINADMLPTVDVENAALTQATMVTQLATLGIQAMYEPDNQEVGGAG